MVYCACRSYFKLLIRLVYSFFIFIICRTYPRLCIRGWTTSDFFKVDFYVMKITWKVKFFTELLKNKCVVTSLLDNFRSRWISFLKQFTEPNCPKRTSSQKGIGPCITSGEWMLLCKTWWGAGLWQVWWWRTVCRW